jgi:crossover junction endodeoxyribonuclease RuvC
MIVGIDPGAHGAIAFLTDAGALITVVDMPSVQVVVGKGKRTRVVAARVVQHIRNGIHNPLAGYGCPRFMVERASSMPGQGVASMFSFGFAAGICEGVIAGLGFPLDHVTPVVWKRALHVPADKGGARMRASEEFPEHADLFARVKDDGRAESALIGLYAARRAA